jgi:hypothetical protein
MLWFALPVRVYLKPAVSKNFYGFCCGSAPCGWLTGGCKGARRRKWSKKGRQIFRNKKIFNKKEFFPPCLLFQGHVTGTTPFFLGLTGLCRGRMKAEAFMQLQQLRETPFGYILKK